jgi:hypothetical protein
MTGTYTIVQLQRQDELTYAIRGRIAEAQKKQEEKGNKQASDHIRDGMAMDWSRRLVEKGHRLGTGGHIINFLSAAFNVADRMDLLILTAGVITFDKRCAQSSARSGLGPA